MVKPAAQLESTQNAFFTVTSKPRSQGGYSFWKWTAPQSQWVLVENRSALGFEPGVGPTLEGRFDGQTVRWMNVVSQ